MVWKYCNKNRDRLYDGLWGEDYLIQAAHIDYDMPEIARSLASSQSQATVTDVAPPMGGRMMAKAPDAKAVVVRVRFVDLRGQMQQLPESRYMRERIPALLLKPLHGRRSQQELTAGEHRLGTSEPL